jgi:hypothetical protein
VNAPVGDVEGLALGNVSCSVVPLKYFDPKGKLTTRSEAELNIEPLATDGQVVSCGERVVQ